MQRVLGDEESRQQAAGEVEGYLHRVHAHAAPRPRVLLAAVIASDDRVER